MQAWQQIVLLWLAFAVTHLGLSHGSVRKALVARLGSWHFMGVYSLISLAIFVPLVAVYMGNRHQGAVLWNLLDVPGVKHVAMLLALLSIAGVVAGYAQPAPTGLIPGKSKSPYGLTRITRHPLFMSLGLWGLSHCLINGFASDVAFFAGFPLFAIIGCAHQDSRKRQDPSFDQYFAYTSMLPFVAQITGKGGIVIGELPWLGLLLGVAVGLGVYMSHGVMFF